MVTTTRTLPDTPRRAHDGFSLVEALIATFIGLMIMGAAITVARQTALVSASMSEGATAQEEAQFAMEWITGVLRSAGSNPYAIVTSGCPAAGTQLLAVQIDPNMTGLADNIRIQADLNPPNGMLGGAAGACNESGEDITIAFDAANRAITRRDNNIDAAAVPMTDRVVTQLRFTPLDINRAITSVAGQTVYVQVSIIASTISRDAFRGTPTTFGLLSEVRVRVR
jgi:Tfp pilus assembly protein PilW